MSIVFLIVGTVLTLLLVGLLLKRNEYDYMIEPLDEDSFPMKFFYSVGFALQEKKLRLQGKLGNRLREEANLLYGQRFGEFYARAVWAQTISFVLVSMALMFCLAGVMADNAMFFGMIGVVLAVLSAYYFMSRMRGKLDERRNDCEDEFPNTISKLALLVNSGVILHEAWRMVAYGKEGRLYDMMRDACNSMDNGMSEIDAIYEFGVHTNSHDIKKFASALIQSIERGGAELTVFLSNQSGELWAQRRQTLLQKGEKAAGALLMPIALMFLGVMMIVVVAAVQSFGL